MSDEKKPMTETAFDRKMDARVKDILEAQAKRDAEQDAKLQARPSRMQGAIDTAEDFDFTKKYPLVSVVIALAVLAGSTAAHAYGKLDTVPMYVLWGIAVCLIPGLAMKVVRLATGLKKAKGE